MNPVNPVEQSTAPAYIPDPALTRSPVWGDHPAVLADIFQDDVNIATWRRELPNTLRDVVDQVVASSGSLTVSMSVAPHDAFESIRESLGTDSECPLSRDVAELVDMFCYLLGIKRAGLRLAVLDSAMCPKFHVDRVPCRLITTYRGTGTEWLQHEAVNRSRLGLGSGGKPDHESGLYRSAEDIEQLNCGDVALMKGELWENNEGAGLVHRSPSVDDGIARLLLSLDVSD